MDRIDKNNTGVGNRARGAKDLLDCSLLGSPLNTSETNLRDLIIDNTEQVAPNFGNPNPSLASYGATVATLVEKIQNELEGNLGKLLTLNPSRREAVARHLEKLSNQFPGPAMIQDASDAAGGLRVWLDPARSPARSNAISQYCEEIGKITLGQILVLKAWSDRGLRKCKLEDLGRLNWVLSCAVKPHIPLQREGWQITRPNLYSWYTLSSALQQEIWSVIENWDLSREGSFFLAELLQLRNGRSSKLQRSARYDDRFYLSIWKNLEKIGFSVRPDSRDPIQRSKVAFSPTLRDGTLARLGPDELKWVGLEKDPFSLFSAELVKLWSGPAAPPLWCHGTGLEVHSRDQLSFRLGSPKPSLLNRITEMEACDLSFVVEEKSIRLNGRSQEAAAFREQIESLTYFKNLRAPASSQGALNACISLNKLRPGGFLIWTREEPLNPAEGSAILQFLLERGKLVCEWDFSQVSHSLPGSVIPFPKYVYLFQREVELEARMSHRPLRITVSGQIRSHIEVPVMLDDALCALFSSPSNRENWKVNAQNSPSPQRDWLDHWPDPAQHRIIEEIEALKSNSKPLASLTTVRTTPNLPSGESWAVEGNLRGLFVHKETSRGGETRQLKVERLPEAGAEIKNNGFLVLVPDEFWIAPLKTYLRSESVANWIEFHAEKKSGRWLLNEQIIKFIPIPQILHEMLTRNRFDQANAKWGGLNSELLYDPKAVREKICGEKSESPLDQRAYLFVQASQMLQHLENTQKTLFSLVRPSGEIKWKELLKILPPGELMNASLHPEARLSGVLPAHLPITRIEKSVKPMPGVIFTTESGFYLHLGCTNSRLVDIVWDQLEGVNHPTWGELSSYLKLPRNLAMADATANDLLRSHGEQMEKMRELKEILGDCSFFRQKPSAHTHLN